MGKKKKTPQTILLLLFSISCCSSLLSNNSLRGHALRSDRAIARIAAKPCVPR